MTLTAEELARYATSVQTNVARRDFVNTREHMATMIDAYLKADHEAIRTLHSESVFYWAALLFHYGRLKLAAGDTE